MDLPSVLFLFSTVIILFSHIREIFYWIHSFVEKKFPRKSTEPFILDFFFFQLMCPAIVNPCKYGLLTELPEHALIGLITVSKLMKDTAMGVVDRWEDPLISSFISKYHPLILTFIRSLLNEEEIYISKQIVLSSCVQVEFSPEDRNACVSAVRSFLHNYALLLTKRTEEIPLPVSRDSPEMVFTTNPSHIKKSSTSLNFANFGTKKTTQLGKKPKNMTKPLFTL